jgi:hypothetical protein
LSDAAGRIHHVSRLARAEHEGAERYDANELLPIVDDRESADPLARAGTAPVVVSTAGLRIDAAARRRPPDGSSLP